MKEQGSIALFQYWNMLRGERPAPRRTEIEPADIKTLLADTFILEKDQRGAPVFRLAGTRMCSIYDRELKGFSFASLWSVPDRGILARLVGSAFDSKSVVVVTFEGHSRGGRINPFELIVLPLDGGHDNPRVLGALVPSALPFWLGADPIVENRLETMRVIDPAREPLALGTRPAVAVPPLAPGAANLHDEDPRDTDGGRRIRHLVVFEGGREN